MAQLQKLSSDSSLISSPCGIVHLNAIAPGQDTADTVSRCCGVTLTLQPKMGTLLEMSLRDLADIRESLQEETEAFRHVVLGVGNSLRELVALSYGQEVSRVFAVLTTGSQSAAPFPVLQLGVRLDKLAVCSFFRLVPSRILYLPPYACGSAPSRAGYAAEGSHSGPHADPASARFDCACTDVVTGGDGSRGT